MPITANGQTYSDDTIKGFFASNPDSASVAKQAASLGFNAGQIQQAGQIAGKNWTANDVNGTASSLGYNFGGANGGIIQNAQNPTPATYNINTANVAGYSAGNGGSNGMSNGTLTTQGGQQVTHDQLSQFAATNPNDQQIMAKASEWGMSMPDVSTALNNLGLLYNGGNPTSVQMNDPNNGSIYNRLSNGAYRGDNGYGVATNPGGGANTNGQVVAGNGHSWVDDGNGSGHWAATGSNSTGYNTPGTFANPTGAPGGATAAPATSGAPSTGGGIIGNAAGGSSNPNWVVDAPQTVSGQFNNLTNGDNVLMQKARTQALEGMNGRGLVNSSLAQTAGDSAAYDAALQIAKPDAATNAAAAQTNAQLRNSMGIAQLNSQTSKDITGMNIGAQKELQHSSQLFNNLTQQTQSASSIQSWGLNTITTIQASDLSADAKNAAINAVKQYLSSSYQIQGDWHTSAAKAIDAIFH
jgi:hypothetical protein